MRVTWSVRGAASSGWIAHGIQRSAVSGHWKSAGSTPTMVRTRPLIRSVRPITSFVPPNRRFHSRSLIITGPQFCP